MRCVCKSLFLLFIQTIKYALWDLMASEELLHESYTASFLYRVIYTSKIKKVNPLALVFLRAQSSDSQFVKKDKYLEFEVNLRSIVLQQNRKRWAHKEGRRFFFHSLLFLFIHFRRYRVLWTDFSVVVAVLFLSLILSRSKSGSDLWMMWHLQRGWCCWRCCWKISWIFWQWI